MKTINSRRQIRHKVEIFIDPKTGKNNGFVGFVTLYDAEIYVDTRDGTGYSEVIKKLEPLICRFAHKYHFNGNAFEDTKHDVIVHILEGIPKYNPNKEMKLSSFLQMRVNRRLINELRNNSRSSRNATLLNIKTYYVLCKCGHKFVTTVGKDQTKCCSECKRDINDAKKKLPMTIFEVNESMLVNYDGNSDPDMQTTNIYEMLTDDSIRVDDDAIHSYDIKKWLKTEDPRITKIIELMYFHDYSISSAAKEVGLTSAGANMKLKGLKSKRIVRELFGR